MARRALDCFAALAMTAKGVRVAGMFQPSCGVPHPTPLRGATFSHEWEKDLRANLPPSPSPSPRGGGRAGRWDVPTKPRPPSSDSASRSRLLPRAGEGFAREFAAFSPAIAARRRACGSLRCSNQAAASPHPTLASRGCPLRPVGQELIERRLCGFNVFASLGPLKNCRGSGTTGASPGFLLIAESAEGARKLAEAEP